MKLFASRVICCCTVVLLFGVSYIGLPSFSIAAPLSPAVKQELLDAKVDLLEKTNERLLQTVYWTLGTLAAVFLGLISVNLYFNISANKREIEKIKEEIEALTRSLIKIAGQEISEKSIVATQKEFERIKEEISNITISEIKTSEASLIEKSSVLIQREIDKASSNILNTAKNEILTHNAKITELYENSGKRIEKLASSVEQILTELPGLKIRVRELEVYKYTKEGKMGAIFGQIDLLEYDLENRSWNLKFRLPEILAEVRETDIPAKQAERLKVLLGKVQDIKLKEIVDEILGTITIKEMPE